MKSFITERKFNNISSLHLIKMNNMQTSINKKYPKWSQRIKLSFKPINSILRVAKIHFWTKTTILNQRKAFLTINFLFWTNLLKLFQMKNQINTIPKKVSNMLTKISSRPAKSAPSITITIVKAKRHQLSPLSQYHLARKKKLLKLSLNKLNNRAKKLLKSNAKKSLFLKKYFSFVWKKWT